MNPSDRIYVAGHRGLAGSAIVRALRKHGCTDIVVRTHEELDLTDARAVEAFFDTERPAYVFLAAARVGGILANAKEPVEYLTQNLSIQNNVITNAHRTGVKKLLFLGSSCVYPRLAPQPIKEEYLLSGPLEDTNRAYAVAKIAGIELCQAYRREYGDNFIAVMPTNLYGPNDRFDPERSHVLPAMILKFHRARSQKQPFVELWGTGEPRREFLHADDFAEACVFLMQKYDGADIVNIGTGEDITVRELAELVRSVVGFEGEVRWDASKPDGVPRKLLDVSRIHALGWRHSVGLKEGIRMTCEWYAQNVGR